MPIDAAELDGRLFGPIDDIGLRLTPLEEALSMDERPMTGMLGEDALRAGAVRVDTTFNPDGTTTIEWIDINGNTIRRGRGPTVYGMIAVDTPFEPTLEYGVTAAQMGIDLQRLERVFCFGGRDTSDGEDEPDIKEERGGALDEFLDEFKPQITQKEVMNKSEC